MRGRSPATSPAQYLAGAKGRGGTSHGATYGTGGSTSRLLYGLRGSALSVLLRQPQGFEGFGTRQKPHHPGDFAPAERPDECERPLDLNSTGSPTRASGYDRDHVLVPASISSSKSYSMFVHASCQSRKKRRSPSWPR
jgi:hypothetical protein